MTPYPHLFTPIKIGGQLIKNRIFSAPTGLMSYTARGHLTTENMAYYELKAKGGCGVVTLGESIVHAATGQSHDRQICLDDPHVLPSLTNTARAITRYGAVANIELSHGGKYAGLASIGGHKKERRPAYGPSHDVLPSGEEVLEMPQKLIYEILDAYGAAADVAKRAGFGMVMVHAGHGWLFNQFLSPLENHRKDEFGGSLENRARLLLMIIDRIRQYCGEDFLIEVRFSGTEYVEGGYTLKEGVEFAKLMDGRADLLHVSACNFYFPETECLMVPGMFKEEGHNLYLAEEIKKHVKHSHVVSVGAHRDPKKIEDILAAGKVDMIAVCRAVNADPQFVNKLKRNQEEEIRPCLRCNACIANYQTRITKCAINPTLDRPEDEVFPFLPTTPKRVLIAGGGPAGLEAAIVARDRGHEVILCEKTGTLGGLLRYARKVPFKRETQQYVDYMIAKAVRMGVDIRLNTEVTPELVKVIAPDFCIAAVGSKALIPPIPGVEKAHPIMDMYDGKVQVGQKVVIVGGGLAGTEAALELAMQGKQVTLVEMGIDVARDANSIHKPALMMELKDHAEQVTILCRTTCTGIHDHGIVCRDADGKELTLDADTVILAAGMAPLRAEALALEPVSSEFRMVGDCKRPRQILEAVREGYDAAMEV